jgi:hypothetical protein
MDDNRPKIAAQEIGLNRRENLQMDDECIFTSETPKNKPAKENMQWYMDNYGVSF